MAQSKEGAARIRRIHTIGEILVSFATIVSIAITLIVSYLTFSSQQDKERRERTVEMMKHYWQGAYQFPDEKDFKRDLQQTLYRMAGEIRGTPRPTAEDRAFMYFCAPEQRRNPGHGQMAADLYNFYTRLAECARTNACDAKLTYSLLGADMKLYLQEFCGYLVTQDREARRLFGTCDDPSKKIPLTYAPTSKNPAPRGSEIAAFVRSFESNAKFECKMID